MSAISLHYSHSLDPVEWSARYARGEVPDRLPYGLHRLGRPGQQLEVGASPRAFGAVASRSVRFLTGRYEWVPRRHDDGRHEVAVAWDEDVGIPMALRAPRHVEVATGVIWLTDRVRRRGAVMALERRALQRCAAVWALSSAQLPILRSNWGVDDSKLHHLKFGVDRDFWLPGPKGGESGRVLVVGNDRDRDHVTAIRAVELARASRPEIRLHLVTQQDISVPQDVGTHTSALSHVALRGEYQRAELCVVAVRPNQHCSGVTATLEAMACGRPVIVTDTPGMSDYVTHGYNGLLVPPNDPRALAESIERVMSNPALGAEMGEAGRRTVEQSLNTVRQAEQLTEILSAM